MTVDETERNNLDGDMKVDEMERNKFIDCRTLSILGVIELRQCLPYAHPTALALLTPDTKVLGIMMVFQ
jgi:hypothetical protein